MCELFGMSSRIEANVTFSLALLGERGGRIGPHKDGWGVAFREGRDFRIIKEPGAAADSACLRFIETHDFKSQIVLSHIRKATTPHLHSYTNTHPFIRELYGYAHVFAHNGDLPGVFADSYFEPRYYFPLGQTDSERVFCALMDRLRTELSPSSIIDPERKISVIRSWAGEASKHGIFNFLLSDSEFLFAHRSTRLFCLSKECHSKTECLQSDELSVSLKQKGVPAQHVAIVATESLTQSEPWQPLPEGEITVFRHGIKILDGTANEAHK